MILDEHDLPHTSIQKFLQLLRDTKKKRIENKVLWEYFRAAFPYRPGGGINRKWLWEALQMAVEQGIIRLPSPNGDCWDKILDPPLPTIVWKIQVLEVRSDKSWREYPWLPQLEWVAQLPNLSQEYEYFLRRVQQHLREGTLQEQAPIKYRSLQLTGNEKRLEGLLHTILFKPGRLSLELLGCAPDIPPLALEEIGHSDIAIVFENAGAFRTAIQAQKQFTRPHYGLIGFGAGAGFEKSVLHFQLIKRKVSHIEYVGDLDRPGLLIAKNAAILAQRKFLPPVIPAQGLHRAMLTSVRQFGHSKGLDYLKKEQRIDPSDEDLVAWLPKEVREDCLNIIQSGRRIPEEVLGPQEMIRAWKQLH